MWIYIFSEEEYYSSVLRWLPIVSWKVESFILKKCSKNKATKVVYSITFRASSNVNGKVCHRFKIAEN